MFMIRKTVGGEIKKYAINTEIITPANCGMEDGSVPIILGFYIKNDDDKDVYVRINNGSKMLMKPTETLGFEHLTEVISCVVLTDNSSVRWGGLL